VPLDGECSPPLACWSTGLSPEIRGPVSGPLTLFKKNIKVSLIHLHNFLACSILIYVSFRVQLTSSYSFLHLLTASYSFLQLLTSLTKVLHLLTSSYISLQLLTSLFFHKFILLNFCCCKYYLKNQTFLPKKLQNKYVIGFLF